MKPRQYENRFVIYGNLAVLARMIVPKMRLITTPYNKEEAAS